MFMRWEDVFGLAVFGIYFRAITAHHLPHNVSAGQKIEREENIVMKQQLQKLTRPIKKLYNYGQWNRFTFSIAYSQTDFQGTWMGPRDAASLPPVGNNLNYPAQSPD